jgi:uncharacterized protein (TIGR00730 family)
VLQTAMTSLTPDVAGPPSSVCVFCGSSMGTSPEFAEAAGDLGAALARNRITVVYGGGRVGLMGILADAALDAGGEVVGVLPKGLFRREVAHPGLTRMIEVGSMHERKQRMFDLSDAFVALPGGLGTLEELAEIATWAQLGLHHKPILTVDVRGYWSGLHALLEVGVDEGFLKADNLALISNVDSVGAVLAGIRSYAGPAGDKWVDLGQT